LSYRCNQNQFGIFRPFLAEKYVMFGFRSFAAGVKMAMSFGACYFFKCYVNFV